MKTDDEKSFRLFSDKKKPVLRTSPFHAREYIFREEKRERDRRASSPGAFVASSSLGPLFFVFVFSRVSQQKEVVQKEDFSIRARKTLNFTFLIP